MENVRISECSFYPLRPSEKGLIGIASVLFDNKLSLNSISVYLTPTGDIRLLFPDKILPNSKKVQIYYPVNAETYAAIKKAVAEKLHSLHEKAVENHGNFR